MIKYNIIEKDIPHYFLYKKNLDFNYFETEYYKITIHNNKFEDKFYLYQKDNYIIVQRVDKNSGWKHNLELVFFNKINRTEDIITIGKSNKNIINIELILTIPKDKIHYETDDYKLFYISELYEDVFKVNYNEDKKIILIKRLDKEESWGQDLLLKYIEKKLNKEKVIKIGPSTKSTFTKKIDIDIIHYKENYNYTETNNYIIYIADNKFLDKFEIYFSEDTSIICIRRIDENKGWGQKLKLFIYDKKTKIIETIYIGLSDKVEIFKKIDISPKKCFISLTTIPSRIKLPNFFENINKLLNEQSYPIERLFITIAKKYKRFDEKIEDKLIERIKSISKIQLIIVEEDFGPASKYMGPLINYYNILKDNLLIIVDDDRLYNKNLVKNFIIGFNSFPNITFSSGHWVDYFNKDYNTIKDSELDYFIKKEKNLPNFSFGDGVGGFFGFCIKVSNLEKFIEYNHVILNKVKDSFFHDEGIILGYIKYLAEEILYVKHKGCELIKDEMVDALCSSGLCNREKVEKEILLITNNEFLLNKKKKISEEFYTLKNKCLIIFVGESFRDGIQHSRQKDTEQSYNSQNNASASHNKFIEHIIGLGIDVNIIINTYNTKYEDDLKNWYGKYLIDYIQNDKLIGIEKLLNNVIDKHEKNTKNYDFVFTIRIDLFLKDYFIEKFNPYWDKIYFTNITWRELYKTYNNEPRIADTMIFIPHQYFFLFNLNIYLNHDSWFMYKNEYNLTNNDMDFIIDTYHDSDSYKDLNPLYYMVSRPESKIWHSEGYIVDKTLFSTSKF
jgi:hypothetical protein